MNIPNIGLIKECKCGNYVELNPKTFIGIQQGSKYNLVLMNCPKCKTTISAGTVTK